MIFFRLFQTERHCRLQIQNDVKFSDRVENAVGKGEIAVHLASQSV